MADPLRHRQTKGAATDMVDLRPPRHIPTLPWCFFDVPASNVLVADFPEALDPARRQYRLARPVVPRAEVDELSPAGVRLLERMPTRASTGFPDQANKVPDGPI